MREIMIARRPGTVVINGQRRMVRKGVTTAHADHPIVRDHPRLWEPLKVTHSSGDPVDAEETADAAARRFAGELERLAADLAERGFELDPDAPVDSAPVDTALAALDRVASERDERLTLEESSRLAKMIDDLREQVAALAERTDIPPHIVPGEPSGEGRRVEIVGDGARDGASIRAWAKEQGIEVSPRGKIPAAVVEQYRAAHRA